VQHSASMKEQKGTLQVPFCYAPPVYIVRCLILMKAALGDYDSSKFRLLRYQSLLLSLGLIAFKFVFIERI